MEQQCKLLVVLFLITVYSSSQRVFVLAAAFTSTGVSKTSVVSPSSRTFLPSSRIRDQNPSHKITIPERFGGSCLLSRSGENGFAVSSSRTTAPFQARRQICLSSSSDSTNGGDGTTEQQSLTAKIDSVLSILTNGFPLYVLVAAILGLRCPSTLLWVNQGSLISVMLASVMCGTGLTLTMSDFTNVLVAKTGTNDNKIKGDSNNNWMVVPLGVLCQFIIMPLTAAAVGRALLLSKNEALFLGLTLVGCSPGGTASNLVTLIAQANVALSVILTTCSTLMAVVMTPLLVKWLVGVSHITVSGRALVEATARVVLLPVLIGVILNSRAPKFSRFVSRFTPFCSTIIVALICGGVVSQNASIVMSSTTSASNVLWPVIASVLSLHTIGFAAGYIVPKLVLPLLKNKKYTGDDDDSEDDESTCRTISIEVGMQNSALAVVLARSITDHPLASLPGALSATAHSCLGSILAAYWRSSTHRRNQKKQKMTSLPSVEPQIRYTGDDDLAPPEFLI